MPTLADLKYYADTQVDTPYLARMMAAQPSLSGISALAGGSTLSMASPRQQREAQAIRGKVQPVVDAAKNAVTDPYYAMTPGVDQRRQDARRRILEKVAAVTTDPMAATFAGVGAKMADKAALARSLEMKAAGVPDREIWQQTGWTHGFPDGKPRFEIDDSAAALETKASGTTVFDSLRNYQGKDGYSIDLVYSHPELFNNYEELAEIRARFPKNTPLDPNRLATPNSAAFDGSNIYFGQGIDAVNAKSTIAHELQHAVQSKEGFAIGGGPEEFTRQAAAETARDALSYARELQQLRKKYPDADISTLENKLTEEYQRLDMMEWLPSREARDLGRQPYVLFADKYPDNKGYQELTDLVKTYKLDQRATPLSAMDAYKSLAGEVEARLTQRRMSLNAQQRRQRYPIDDMDVKPEDQIVRFK